MLPTDLAAWHDRVRRVAPPPGEAYAIAVSANRGRELARPGYRLYWMTRGLLASREVPAEPGGHVVVGRHDRCDVVLDDERAVSLRHALVRSTLLDDGCPTLGVLDLRTSDGFELSDGTKQHGIVASGPVVFRVGSHTVVALPSSGNIPDSLPSPLVERVERSALPNAPAVKVEAAIPHREAPPREPGRGPVSRITLTGGSVNLSERRSYFPGFAGAWDAHANPDHVFEVVLGMRGFRAAVRFTASDLEQGILIGRDEKCVDAGLRPILAESISRVHVLLIREKGEQVLYDTGSTNGTTVNGVRVRSVPLLDSGTTVEIAGPQGVTLDWRALRSLQ